MITLLEGIPPIGHVFIVIASIMLFILIIAIYFVRNHQLWLSRNESQNLRRYVHRSKVGNPNDVTEMQGL